MSDIAWPLCAGEGDLTRTIADMRIKAVKLLFVVAALYDGIIGIPDF